MNDHVYTLGVDPAKEKVTACLIDTGGVVVAGPLDLSCNRQGFDALLALLGKHVPESAKLVVGVESSASLDDNVLRLFTSQRLAWKMHIIRADAAQVKSFSGPRPVRGKTDKADSRRIAQFTHTYAHHLAEFMSDPQTLAMERLSNERMALAEDIAAQKNRLRDRLVISFPELTTVFSDPCSGPALALLRVAPTAHHAATKRLSTLANAKADRHKAHSVGLKRATAIQALARTSIASACTDTDAATIVRLTQRLAMLLEQKEEIDAQIERFVATPQPTPGKATAANEETTPQTAAAADVAHQIRIIDSTPGIGLIGASAIVLRACGVRRYTTPKAFAAQMGVCPERRQTGTSRDTAHLTRRGDRRVRAIMFMCVMAACRADRAMAFHHWRLKRAGLTPKQAYCACMNRLARLLWTLVQTNTPYDQNRAIQNAQKHHPQLWKTFLETQKKLGKTSEENFTIDRKEVLI